MVGSVEEHGMRTSGGYLRESAKDSCLLLKKLFLAINQTRKYVRSELPMLSGS